MSVFVKGTLYAGSRRYYWFYQYIYVFILRGFVIKIKINEEDDMMCCFMQNKIYLVTFKTETWSFSYNPKFFLIWFKLTYCMSGFVLFFLLLYMVTCLLFYLHWQLLILLFWILNFYPKLWKQIFFFLFKIINSCMLTLEFLK